jgi:hypothetical protein
VVAANAKAPLERTGRAAKTSVLNENITASSPKAPRIQTEKLYSEGGSDEYGKLNGASSRPALSVGVPSPNDCLPCTEDRESAENFAASSAVCRRKTGLRSCHQDPGGGHGVSNTYCCHGIGESVYRAEERAV